MLPMILMNWYWGMGAIMTWARIILKLDLGGGWGNSRRCISEACSSNDQQNVEGQTLNVIHEL